MNEDRCVLPCSQSVYWKMAAKSGTDWLWRGFFVAVTVSQQ